jgi:hypothetical protein
MSRCEELICSCYECSACKLIVYEKYYNILEQRCNNCFEKERAKNMYKKCSYCGYICNEDKMAEHEEVDHGFKKIR